MNTIVVGVDASPQAQDAASFAGRLAAATGAGIRLVCAYPYSPLATGVEVPRSRAALREEAEATLTRLGALLDGAADVTAQTVADASPAHALHEVATRTRAALIVVGSSHVGRLGRVFPGSTAERLLHGATTAVAVVPTGARERHAAEIAPVGVAFDGSPESHIALAAAVAAARDAHAPLEVIQVCDDGDYPSHADGAVAERRAAEGLERAVAELTGDVDVTGVLRSGSPARELVAASGTLGILFMGSRGYGPLHAVLVGGTSGAVVRDASCPVLVTPRGAKIDTEITGAAVVV